MSRDPEALLQALHSDYIELNPQARRVYELLAERGEQPSNDHIALRTYDDPRVAIDVLARPFEACGYQRMQAYDFPAKKLKAWHFEHRDGQRPKIFISALRLDQCEAPVVETIHGLLDQLPADFGSDETFLYGGRPWQLEIATYEALREASEYAGWVAAFGFRANHFTVAVDSLRTFDGLAELNHFLAESGIPLNESGGLIKGTPEDLLQQSSTQAGSVAVAFSDGELVIPACYVEFAQRFRQEDGSVFQGFIARSADRIFESTDRKKPKTERVEQDDTDRRLKG